MIPSSKTVGRVVVPLLLATLVSGNPLAALDCAKASSVREKLICSDQELSRLDSELNVAYQEALKKGPKAVTRKLLQAEQRAWLALVADKSGDKSSLGDAMRARISELKSQTGKARTTFAESPTGEVDDEQCPPEIELQKAVLKAGIASEIKIKSYFCEGAAHPGCEVTVSNTKNGKPFALNSLFKKGVAPVKVLKAICEESPMDEKDLSYWTGRCEEIEWDRVAIKPEGLVITFDRVGPAPCGVSPTIKWKQLKKYLAPKGPVAEAVTR